MAVREALSAAALAVVALLLLAPEVAAQADGTPGSTAPAFDISEDLPERPAGYEITARQAIRVAKRDPKVAETRERYGNLDVAVEAKPPAQWQVGYFADGREVAQVLVDDPSATVDESWTGYQVAWQMARGYSGSFGHKLNAPYVWLPLCALFFFGLLDWRRPWRIVHLDLLVLLGFGVSHIFFNNGEIGVSVPLAYPVLLYLLARMLWIGFRGAGLGLRPAAPVVWLAVAAAFLVGFRIALNVADSGVIDVGYSGVVGADRAIEGDPLYGADTFPDDNQFGDTYGPVNYYAYVPLEQVLPWSGEWDERRPRGVNPVRPRGGRAARAARSPDAARSGGPRPRRDSGVRVGGIPLHRVRAAVERQRLSGGRARARRAGADLDTGRPRGDDGARGAHEVRAVRAGAPVRRRPPRGPAGDRPEDEEGPFARDRLRSLALFVTAFVGVGALAMLPTLLDPGLSTFWERTVESQVDRDSPFSIWGQEPDLEPLRTGLIIATVALALLVAFVPRCRTLPRIAALAAAILIAIQLTAEHWFYLYIVWFFPLACAALAERGAQQRPTPADMAGVGDSKRSLVGVSSPS